MRSVVGVANNVSKVKLQRLLVARGLRLVKALGKVEDDACKSICVKVDLLVVRDLANEAGKVSLYCLATTMLVTYLTSPNPTGSSTVMVPPKSWAGANAAMIQAVLCVGSVGLGSRYLLCAPEAEGQAQPRLLPVFLRLMLS